MIKEELHRLKQENIVLNDRLEFLEKENAELRQSLLTSPLPQFLIDQIDSNVYIKDITNGFRYMMVNQKFCKLNNVDSNDILGKDDFQIFPKEQAQRYRDEDIKLHMTKGSITKQDSIIANDGKREILRTTKTYAMTPEKQEILICISHYISKDIEKEERLKEAMKNEKETNNMMKAIFQELPSAILIKDIDNDYRFYLINRKFEQMLNIPEKELIGKTDFEIFPPNEAQKFREDDVQSSLHSKDDPKIIEEIVCSPDKKNSTHLQTLKFSITHKKKRLLICVGIDVTDQHNTMLKLQDALNRAQTADKLKSLFITNMSHEIRTPLNAIVGFSQLLMETQDKGERDEFYKIISHNNDLLISLVNDILSLSIIESGTDAINNELFDFSGMFNSTALTLAPKIDNPQVEFINENNYSEVIIKSNEIKLTQLITNLVNNAIKFTSSGFVKMSYTLLENAISVEIADTGIGIKDEDKERIFRRFEKVNPFIQGTGLGLSICKSITEQLNGEIKVDSQYGKGTTFTFKIPCDIVRVTK